MMASNESVGLVFKAESLKKAFLSKTNVAVLKDPKTWQKLQEFIEVNKLLVLTDLDFALEKKAEVDLWNFAFKEVISHLQSEANSRSILDKAKKSEASVYLSWFLDFASGFYILLLQEICLAYDIDLPFLRSASFYGVNVDSADISSAIKKCNNVANINYICAHCLVHLGDLARYKGLSKQAETFYRHTLKVAPASGHAYNQLALLEVGKGCNLSAVFYYARALALKCPFPAASTNLSKMYTKILASSSQPPKDYSGKFLVFLAHLHSAIGLKKAVALCSELSEILTDLVASESLKVSELLKCVAILLFHASTDKIDESSTPDEKLIRRLQIELLAGMLNALLLPVYTLKQGSALVDFFGLPIIKLILDWLLLNPKAADEPGFLTRQQIWPGLARMLNDLNSLDVDNLKHDDFPLPEDFDLQAFLPLSERQKAYNFRQVLKGSTLALNDIKFLRATRLVSQGHDLSLWQGRSVLCFNKEVRVFESPELAAVSPSLLEAMKLDLVLESDEELKERPDEEVALEEERPRPKQPRKNVAMAAILRQAATSEGQRQVTFKSPSPNASEDSNSQPSSTISQESPFDVKPSYMMKAPQRPTSNVTRPPFQMDFSVPPPPILQGQTGPWPQLNYPHFPNQFQRSNSSSEQAAAVVATFGGPSYSLFSGSGPSWSLPTRDRPQQPQQPPRPSVASLNQQNFLFQPGPSPLERLLQQNPRHQ